MMKLTYKDMTDSRTLTFTIFQKQQDDIKILEEQLERQKEFDRALTNYLQNHGEMEWKLYCCATVWLYHSEMSVSDIFEKIREKS